jgi:hypothetical protein
MLDEGILVFDYLIPEENSDFIKAEEVSERTFGEMEIEKFGISHSELDLEFIGKWCQVSEVVEKSVKRFHSLPPRNKIKLEIPGLVNWTNQIASNNDMHYGIAIHVNNLYEICSQG